VARPPAEALEPLLQQGESEAIGEIVWWGFYEVHALSQHGSRRRAIRYGLNPTRGTRQDMGPSGEHFGGTP
jgi:hypothetical protein